MKRSLQSLEVASSNNITQITEDELVDLAGILAHIIIGVQPYLDISTVQLMLIDALQSPLSDQEAQRLGETIAKAARISIPDDQPGGVH